MEDLIFITPKIYCPKCSRMIETSIEELDDNEEITCPHCSFVFTPNFDVEKLLKLMKEVEKVRRKDNSL